MQIDWVVAIAVFLIFVTWSFTYYTQLFETAEADVSEALDIVSSSITENLTVSVRTLPISYSADPENGSQNAVLWLEYRWPFGRNSTQVFKDGSLLQCNITGNRLYWQTAVSSGSNYYSVRFSEQDVPLRCTGGFAVVNETKAFPFAAEEQMMVSLSMIYSMNSTPYADFRSHLGINRDFRVTATNASGTFLSYGPEPPRDSDVFSKRVVTSLEDTGGNLTLRFLTW